MRASSRKIVSLLMLIMFLMGSGSYGFNSKGLAHDLDHDRQTLDVLTDHDHAPLLDANGDSDSEPLSDTEHQLLESVGHVQPLLISSNLDAFEKDPPRTTPMLPRLLLLPSAEIEPLFRPPRTTSHI